MLGWRDCHSGYVGQLFLFATKLTSEHDCEMHLTPTWEHYLNLRWSLSTVLESGGSGLLLGKISLFKAELHISRLDS